MSSIMLLRRSPVLAVLIVSDRRVRSGGCSPMVPFGGLPVDPVGGRELVCPPPLVLLSEDVFMADELFASAPPALPCSGKLDDEVLPCAETERRSWMPVGYVASAASSRPADLPEFMELRRSRRLRLAARRLWLCMSRRRHRSSSGSVGSEVVRMSSAGGGATAARSLRSAPGSEQMLAMDEDRTKRGFLASPAGSVPKQPPRDSPRLSSISSDSRPAALPAFSPDAPPSRPNRPRKSLDAMATPPHNNPFLPTTTPSHRDQLLSMTKQLSSKARATRSPSFT
uniref:Uncharacterized protein n=1 Tax=Arundo donax TaxID=35708 RepID=A0A0A9CKT6_ARUDO